MRMSRITRRQAGTGAVAVAGACRAIITSIHSHILEAAGICGTRPKRSLLLSVIHVYFHYTHEDELKNLTPLALLFKIYFKHSIT